MITLLYDFASFFHDKVQSVHTSIYTIIRRPAQVDVNAGLLVACDHGRSEEADQLGTMQNLSTRPSCNMVNQGREAAVVSVHRVAVQQVTGFWFVSPRLQIQIGPLLKKDVFGCQPDKGIQTSLEFVISFKDFGESYTISTAGILGQ